MLPASRSNKEIVCYCLKLPVVNNKHLGLRYYHVKSNARPQRLLATLALRPYSTHIWRYIYTVQRLKPNQASHSTLRFCRPLPSFDI